MWRHGTCCFAAAKIKTLTSISSDEKLLAKQIHLMNWVLRIQCRQCAQSRHIQLSVVSVVTLVCLWSVSAEFDSDHLDHPITFALMVLQLWLFHVNFWHQCNVGLAPPMWYIKAAIINIFIVTTDHMTPPRDLGTTLASRRTSGSFSLFLFAGAQRYSFGSLSLLFRQLHE